MKTQVGVIKQTSGLVVAIDENGVSRVLKAGDALYQGEVIKTSSASSKAVVSMDNGKDVTILGDETFKLDEAASNQNANTVADVSDLQKALLDGKDLSNLEETAAGGNAAAGGGDGVSLGAVSFEHGGHYSNISADTSAINPLGAGSFAGPVDNVGGGAADVADTTLIDPDLTRKPSKPTDVNSHEDENHDGKISDDENRRGDNDHGKTTVDVTLPNDGSVKPGDKVIIRDENGNKIGEKEITKDDIDNGGKVSVPDVPVKPGDNTITAEIVNPNNPDNPSDPIIGNIIEDSDRKPSKPTDVNSHEDENHDGKISDDENRRGDNDHGKTTVDVTLPNDGSVKPGDKVIIRDENGNKIGEKEITKDDIDNGGKVSVPDVPVKPGDNTITAEIVNPNNPDNPSDPIIGNIIEDSDRKPSKPTDVNSHEDENHDGKISDDENRRGDNDHGKTTVDVTLPNDGSVKPGDKVIIRDENGNKIGEKEITKDDIDNGGKVSVPDVPVKPGDNTITAEIVNPNNPDNPSDPIIGNIIEDSDRKPSKPTDVNSHEDENHDGKISDDENRRGDNDHGKTTVDVTLPNDGSVKPGDKVIIRDENGNKIGEKEITKDDIDNGGKVSVPDVPVKPGDNTITAEIVNPNNPDNPSDPIIGNIIEDGTRVPDKAKGMEFDEDANKDGRLTDAENRGGDNDTGTTTIVVTVPTDGNIKVGDKVVIRDEDGNKVAEKEITQGDLDNGGKVTINGVPINTGANNPFVAEIVNPNNPTNPSEPIIGNIDVDSLVPDEPVDPETTRVPDKAKGMEFDEDANKDGRLTDAENRGGDNDTGTTTIVVTVPTDGNIKVGDKVVIRDEDGNKVAEKEITQGDLDNGGKVTINGVPINTGANNPFVAEIVNPNNPTNPSEPIIGNIDVDSLVPDEPVDPETTRVPDKAKGMEFDEDANKDGRLTDAENRGGDNDTGTTTIVVTVPTDGNIKVGDKVVIRDEDGNKVAEKEITQGDLDNGGKVTINGVPINTGANNPFVAEIVNPNNPTNPSEPIIGNIDVDSLVPDEPVDPETTRVPDKAKGMEFDEDANKDGRLTDAENRGGDNDTGTTTIVVTVPTDGNIKVGDKVVIRDEDGNKVAEKEITQGDLDNGGKVTINGVPINTGANNPFVAEIVNPNNPTNPSEPIIGNIDVDSLVPDEPVDPETTRVPDKAKGMEFDEDANKDGRLTDAENRGGDNDTGTTTIVVTVPTDGNIKVGDKVVIRDEDGNKVAEKEITQGDLDNGGKVTINGVPINTGANNPFVAEIVNPNNPTNPSEPIIGNIDVDSLVPDEPVDPETTRVPDKAKGMEFDEDANKDGRLTDAENRGGDNDTGTTTIVVTVPTDGNIKVGDKVVIRDEDGNKVAEKEITQGDLDNGGKVTINGVPINTGANNPFVAEIVNPNNPTNPSEPIIGNIDVDSLVPDEPVDPETTRVPDKAKGMEFDEDANKDGRLTDAENRGGDNDTGTTTIVVTVPTDGNIKVGDKVVIRDEDGNKVAEKEITQGDLDNGGKVTINGVPINTGANNPFVAEIVNPNNPTNPSEPIIGNIDVDSLVPDEPVDPETTRVPDKAKGMEFDEDANKDGRLTDAENRGGDNDTGTTTIVVTVPTDGNIKVGDKVVIRDEDGNKVAEKEITQGDLDNGGKVTINGVPINTGANNPFVAEIVNPNNPTNPSEPIIGNIDVDSLVPDEPVDPETTRVPDKAKGMEFDEDANKDGRLTDAENRGGDNDTGTTTIVVTVPTDGNIKVGDKVVIRDEDGNKVAEKEITQGDLDNGGKVTINGVPINTGANNPFVAEIVNPNNPTNPSEPIIGNIDVDSLVPDEPVDPETTRVPDKAKGMEFDEDANKDGRLTDAENRGGDNDTGTTTIVVTVPTDGNIKVGDKVVIRDEDGNKVAEKEITQGDLDNGGKVTINGVPINTGANNPFVAEIVNPNNPTNPSEPIIGNIDVDSLVPDEPVDPETTRVPDKAKGMEFDEDANKDGRLTDAENRGGDNDTGTTTIVVTVPTDGNIKVGDKVVIRDEDGNKVAEKEITQGDLDNGGKVTINGVPINTGANNPFVAEIVNPNNPTNPSEPIIGNIDVDSLVPDEPVDPETTRVPDKAKGMEFDEDANKDGRLTDAENRGGDNDTGTTTIVVTVPTDGNIKVGDKVVIRDEDGNKVAEKEITQGDLDNGGKVTINGVPINTGANNPFVAEIVNPNNPTNPSEPIIGNIDVDSLVPDEPVDPETTRVPDKAKGMEFDEDANKDGRLTDAENRGGDNDTGTTTIVVTVPTDGNIKVGDKVVIRDENGNKVGEKEITQGDLDNGGKVTINGVPINTGANNPFVAEIVNPNNPDNPSDPIIGNIDVDSLVPDEPVDPEKTRVPDKAKGMEFDEDANKDGRLTDAENRGGDNDTGTTTIIVTVPTDGNIKVGDKVVIRDENGNKVGEKEITQGDLDNGGKVTINGVPINTGANNPFVAEIVNPNNPDNPSDPIIGNIDVDSLVPDEPVDPEKTRVPDKAKGMEFDEDANKDGRLTDAENRGGDNDTGTTTIVVTVPTDGNIKVGDKVVIRDENGNKVGEKEITQGDLDNGGKVTINGVPINTGANNPFVAEIVNPNNPDNPSDPIIGNIDVDSLVPDEPVDPEKTRVPDKAKGMEFDEDANKDGRLTDAENRGGDNDTGTTTIVVTVPTDGNIKVGDKVVIRDENGNKVGEKEITQGDLDNGGKVTINGVPINTGANNPFVAEIVNPNNPDNPSDPIIGNIDVAEILAITAVTDNEAGGIQDGNNVLGVNGGLTNDKTPTIKGTADKGSTVKIYDNGEYIGETTADANGKWEFTPALEKEGVHKFTAKAGDSTSNEAVINLDATMKIEFSVDLTIDDCSKPGANAAPIFTKEQTTNNSDLLIINHKLDNNTKVDLKGGNDDLFVGGRVIGNSVINAGEGNDRINIDDSLGWSFGKGTVNLGEGGDTKVIKTRIHGKTSDGDTDYIVKGENGNVIYEGTTDSNGNFDVSIANVVKPGEKITVEMTDKAGNSGKASNKAHAFGTDGNRYYNNELLVGTDIHDGVVTAGDGNDKVVVGTKGGSKHITGGSKINLGNGDNELIVGTNIAGSRVAAGNGDDIVTVGQWKHPGDSWISDGSIVDLGDGNNRLTVGTNIDLSRVTTGSGDDIVKVGGHITNKSIMDLGDGSNHLTVGTNIDHSRVTTGSGDDIVEVSGHIWNSKDESRSNHPGEADYSINLGDGNNTLTVEAEVKWSSITTGSGDDKLEFKTYMLDSKVETGKGSDTIKVGTYVEKSTINLGDGNDTIEVGYLKGNNNNIDGGAGHDILSITNPGNTIDLSSIAKQAHNFEELNISNGQAGTTLKIGLKDVVDLTDDNNILKISGDAGDAVSFKEQGWSKGGSDNGYTSYTNNFNGKTVTIQIEDEIIRPL